MAIVKMNKVSAIGLEVDKSGLIKELMELGVVEISSQDYKLTDPEWISYVEKDGNENDVLNYDSKLATIESVLESLDKYDRSKKPMFNTRKAISNEQFETAMKDKNKIQENVDYILKLNTEINEINSEENKIEAGIISLKPWIGYQIPLEINETKYTNVFIGVVPNIVNIEKLRNDMDEKTERYYLDVISSDKDQYYISIICLKNERDHIYEVLKQHGFNLTSFKDLTGTAAENIIKYEKKLKEISNIKLNVEEEISNYLQYKEEIELLHDHLIIERDKSKILTNMLKTDKTFYLSGWTTEKSKDNVEKVLKEYDCWYEIKEPEEGEEYPILLSNNSFVQPFETVTELYSLPSSSNIDPTPSMSFFFFAFFGLMLGDAGYGLIMVALCALVIFKFNVEGTMRKMLKMLMFAGISTAFWGVMFGSWFGDAVPVGAKVLFNADVTLGPAWFNPMENPMKLLIFSFLFGVVHLFVGMGVNAYMLIRDGKPWDALFDIGFWYVLIIGLGLLLFGDSVIAGAGGVGKWLSIAGAIGLILTQGRAKKNIIGKAFGGVMSLYNITSYLSDILSYSRLLALGIATGVVSSVVNILGSLGGKGFFGSVLFIAVFLFGHTFNFAINALGAFVHSARLQYVEFFGKFYEGGGEAFNPLIKKTKYVKIIKEEN